MTKRIFRVLVLSAAVVLVLSVCISYAVFSVYFSAQNERELLTCARMAAKGVSLSGKDYLEQVSLSGSMRLTWIDADGTVLYDSKQDESTMENHADRPEFIEAVKTGEGVSGRLSKTIGEKTVNAACLADDGTVVRVSEVRQSSWGLFLSAAVPLLIVLSGLLMLSARFAKRVAKSLVSPLLAIDFEHPERTEGTYEELSPILRQLSDQNKRIRAQMETLRRNQQEFAAISENMSEGIVVVGREKEVLSYNTSALKLLGTKTVTGASVLTLNRSEPFFEAVQKALSGEHCEKEMVHDERTYRLISNPVLEQAQVVGAVLIMLDVTEQAESERLRREFTANVSHELKTPLTSISGYAEIISSGIVKPEDVGRFSGRIYEEAQRLIRLVNDIVNLSKLDEGAVMPLKQAVCADEMIEGIVRAMEPAAQKRGITMRVSVHWHTIFGVRAILEEMIQNMVDNAIKYNKENGEVFVTVDHVDDQTRVIVRDTGIGIPLCEQERVFERFYRVDKSHSRAIGGTGLGLSIIKHGALFHGGSVSLSSVPDQGTTITLLLPDQPG